MTSITMTTMSGYAQFGYPYSSASQLLMSGAAGMAPPLSSMGPATTSPTGPCSASASATSPGSTTSTSAGQGASSPCCDSGRPLVTDPVTGQAVCPCQYDRLALSAYSPSAAAAAARLAAVSAASAVSGVGLHGVYSAAYSSSDQNPYPSLGMDGSAFYSLGNPYIKDGGAGDVSAWSSSGLQTAPGYYPYDPALAAYGYGAGYDLAARRKNATRESTATLKAWLSEHKKNPYPTKGEKIMLAIITKMTLTQVSTWFANARRRLKKENKMTWEPKNRQEDDDDGDDEVSGQSDDDSKAKDKKDNADSDINDKDDDDKSDSEGEDPRHPHHLGSHLNVSVNNCGPNDIMPPCQVSHPGAGVSNVPLSLLHRGDGAKSPSKPKIWSLADTAACKTPPPPPGLDGMNPSASSMSMGSHHPSSHPHSHHHHHHHQQWMTGGTMPSSYGPMPSMNKFAAAAAAGFNPYGRYPGFGPAGYGPAASHYNPAASYSNMVISGNHAGHGYSDTVPSTDTPPQTPPNLKLHMLGQYMSPSSTPSATATVSMLASNLPVPIPPSHHHAHHRLMGPNNTGAQTVPDRPGSDLPSPTGSSVSSMSSSSSSSASANPAGNLSMSGNLLPQQHSPDTSAAAFRPVYRGSPGSGATAGYMS